MIFKKISEHNPLTPQEEEYFHLVDCIESFRRSSNILKELLGSELSKTLTNAVYKAAIIEYAKPYTPSHGDEKWKYRLAPPELTKSEARLHNVLMTLRDKVIAHSDLSPKQGKVFPGSATETRAAIVSLNADPKYPEASDVLSLVERTLTLLDERQLQLSSSLFLKT